MRCTTRAGCLIVLGIASTLCWNTAANADDTKDNVQASVRKAISANAKDEGKHRTGFFSYFDSYHEWTAP